MLHVLQRPLHTGRGSGLHYRCAAPIVIEAHGEQVVRGLDKIYAEKGVICEFDIDSGVQFDGEPGDLQELLGNLLENPFKWAKSRVLLTARPAGPPRTRRPGWCWPSTTKARGLPRARRSNSRTPSLPAPSACRSAASRTDERVWKRETVGFGMWGCGST